MNKLYAFLTLFCLLGAFAQLGFGQTYLMPGGTNVQNTVVTCAGDFLDHNGNSNYSNQQKSKFIVCPDGPNLAVQVTFTSFNVETGFDSLLIINRDNYTGRSFTEPNVIGVYWGENNPGTVTSTHPTGCLTFYFSSDGSQVRPGWEATFDCVPVACTDLDLDGSCAEDDCDDADHTIFPGAPEIFCNGIDENCNGMDDDEPAFLMPGGVNVQNTVNTCCGTFTDHNGNSNYSNQQKSKFIVCPDDPNLAVQVTFTSFDVEEGFDSLLIINRDNYTGRSNTEPNVIGVYWGTNNPGTVTSTHPTGCLTFYFSSDGSQVRPGWEATFSCVDCPVPEAVCKTAFVTLDNNGNGTLSAADVDGGSTASCGVQALTVSPNTFTCTDVGSQSVTLTITDIKGDTSSCNTNVTVEDGVAPNAVCQNVTVQLDANGNGSTTVQAIDNGSSDACGVAILSLDVDSFGCADVGANLVTLTVTDVNGNSSTCSATVTVEDNVAPTAVCQSVTVQLDANGNGSTTAQAINNGSSDACGVPIAIGSLSLDVDSFGCADVGANSVILTVTDNNGNSSTCSATVTVEDNIGPVIDCFSQTLVFNGEESIELLAEDFLEQEDNCGTTTAVLNPSSISCADIGSVVAVMVTLTDANGNSSGCLVDVTVEGLPCGFSQDPDGINCANGSSADYDPESETFTLSSTGCYHANPFTQDASAYVASSLCGNGEIITEVTGINGFGWAGLTMRESSAAGSKKIALSYNGSNFARREVRYQTNGPAYPQQFPAFGKRWLRLVRQGNQFRGYISHNGVFWQQVMAANIAMNNCIEAGLFLTNYNFVGTVSATFANTSVSGATAQPLLGQGASEIPFAAARPDQTPTLEIYPNPTSGPLTVDLGDWGKQDVQLEVLSSNGTRMLVTQIGAFEGTRTELQLDQLPVGVYWLRIQPTNAAPMMRRIVVQ